MREHGAALLGWAIKRTTHLIHVQATQMAQFEADQLNTKIQTAHLTRGADWRLQISLIAYVSTAFSYPRAKARTNFPAVLNLLKQLID